MTAVENFDIYYNIVIKKNISTIHMDVCTGVCLWKYDNNIQSILATKHSLVNKTMASL